MVATFDIKRNALSSRWGVWAAEADDSAPVENLLGEFKTRNEAETFREFLAGGKSAQAAHAALKEKAEAEKPAGKSLFGKLRKRNGSAPVANGHKQASNPVIQIQKHDAADEDEPATGAVEHHFEPPATEERPGLSSSIRYEVIETARRPRAARPPAVVEPEHAPARPIKDEAPVHEAPAGYGEPDVVEITAVEPEEAGERPARPQTAAGAERVAQSETAQRVEAEFDSEARRFGTFSRLKAREMQALLKAPEHDEDEDAPEGEKTDRRGLLNWTFTPPPDVSAADVSSHGHEEAEEPGEEPELPAEEAHAVHAAVPEEEVEETHLPVIEPEAPAIASPAAAAQQIEQLQPVAKAITTDHAPSRGKVTIDICTARSLQNESWGDPTISDKKYNSIASKEYTEVSKAMANGASPEHLREELVHLASVCIAWADAIDKRIASQQEDAA